MKKLDKMDLKTFLNAYREGVKSATGKHLSRRKIVENIFKNNPEEWGKLENKYEKWEMGIGKPKDESDRITIKTFFGISDFENISGHILVDAIDRYPEGLHEVETADNKTNSSKQKNKEKLSANKDNLLSSQLTINDEDMHTLNLEMVRHIMEMSKQIVETNSILARKIPDLKDGEVERKPLKERRA